MSAATRHLPARRTRKGAVTAPRQGDPLERWNRHREQHNPLRGLTMARAVSLVESYPRGEFADLMWTLGAPFVGIEAADADLCAIVGRRADALYEMDWNAKEMAGDRVDAALAQEQAAFIDELAESVEGLEDVVEHLALAACRGFSLVEIAPKWTERGVDLLPVDHWNVVRDGLRGDWFYNPSAMQVGASALGEELRLDPRRFVIREVRRPFGRIALAKHVRSNLAERDWSSFAEIFGLPSGVVTMPPDVPEDREAEFEAAARAIAEGGSGALPNGSDYKPNPAVTGKSGAPFREFLDYLTEKLVLVGTGGKLTMLAESGSGTLAGGAHADVWEQLARAEAVRISRVLQQALFAPALQAAWPGRPVSAYWELAYREEVDASQVVDDAVKLKGAGYRIDAAELAEKTGYSLASDEAAAGQESRVTGQELTPATDGAVRNRAAGDGGTERGGDAGIFAALMEQWETVLAEAMVEGAEGHDSRDTGDEGTIENDADGCGSPGGKGFARGNSCGKGKGTTREPRAKKQPAKKSDAPRRDPRSQEQVANHKRTMAEAIRLRDAGEGGVLPLDDLPPDTLAKLAEAGGPKVARVRVEIDPQLLRHQKNRHGAGNEKVDGQVPLTDDDIIHHLPLAVMDPDTIEPGARKGREGQARFVFERQVRKTRGKKSQDTNEHVVVEVRGGDRSGHRAVPVTYRKPQRKSATNRASQMLSPDITSLTVTRAWLRTENSTSPSPENKE